MYTVKKLRVCGSSREGFDQTTLLVRVLKPGVCGSSREGFQTRNEGSIPVIEGIRTRCRGAENPLWGGNAVPTLSIGFGNPP